MFSLAEEKESEKKNRCTSGHEPFHTSLYFLLGEWGFERADVNRLEGPADKVSIMPTRRSRGRDGIQEKQNPAPWGRGNAAGHKEHAGRFTAVWLRLRGCTHGRPSTGRHVSKTKENRVKNGKNKNILAL